MAKKKREFTIDRGGGRVELRVVGITGIEHGPYEARKNKSGEYKKGKNSHFKVNDEGKYRAAIKKAIRENKA